MGGSDAAYAPEPVISARDDRLASLQVNAHDRVFGTHRTTTIYSFTVSQYVERFIPLCVDGAGDTVPTESEAWDAISS